MKLLDVRNLNKTIDNKSPLFGQITHYWPNSNPSLSDYEFLGWDVYYTASPNAKVFDYMTMYYYGGDDDTAVRENWDYIPDGNLTAVAKWKYVDPNDKTSLSLSSTLVKLNDNFKANIALPNTIKYPKYDIKTTSILADITNCFLQYIYINDNEKKKALSVKLNRLIKNINISTFSDFDQLQNMLIRYLLRNIYFFESARRKRETNLILHNRQIEMPSIDLKDNTIGDALRIIVNSGDYNLILVY